MKLSVPTKTPQITLKDIKGLPIQPGNGRKLVLSIFREASCPFCNFRVFELTHNYPGLKNLGLDIVVIFNSTEADVMRFIAKQPRPFRIVADPNGIAHEAFRVKSSMWGKIKAMMFRLPAFMSGMQITGIRGMATKNFLPADFLINEQGDIVETYYGLDIGDHIPMERIELFSIRGLASTKSPA